MLEDKCTLKTRKINDSKRSTKELLAEAEAIARKTQRNLSTTIKQVQKEMKRGKEHDA